MLTAAVPSLVMVAIPNPFKFRREDPLEERHCRCSLQASKPRWAIVLP